MKKLNTYFGYFVSFINEKINKCLLWLLCLGNNLKKYIYFAYYVSLINEKINVYFAYYVLIITFKNMSTLPTMSL
jgi:hypothetical protein